MTDNIKELQALIFKPTTHLEQNYGINIFKVQEILTFTTVTKLPNSPPELLGLLQSRGELIPLLDLSFILYKTLSDLQEPKMIIVCHANNTKVALLTASVSDILHSTWEQIQDIENISSQTGNLINGILTTENNSISLLNLEKIIVSYINSEPQNIITKNHQAIQGKRVLIIDDSKWAQNLISHSLKELSIEHNCANNGKEALELIRAKPDNYFNLVLCDIEMPVMDGFTFLSEASKELSNNKPPIVMYSSLCDEVSIGQAMKLGAKHYVTKYDINKLITSIEEHAT